MISEPSRHCTVELQALPSRIGQVRRIISAQLRYWHLDPLIDQAALGVTELLTNVHRHAQPDKSCTVDIELLLDRLTVSVHDHDPRVPTVNEADSFATSGRGLALIAAVSESWGVRPSGAAGKAVWFTFAGGLRHVDPAAAGGLRVDDRRAVRVRLDQPRGRRGRPGPVGRGRLTGPLRVSGAVVRRA